jgi:hypothetical protein
LQFTTKQECCDQQRASICTITTYETDRYVTYHQTSGTQGRPLTRARYRGEWRWWTECWRYVYAAAGVTPKDRIFSRSRLCPFIGFWSAHARRARSRSALNPGGGLDRKGDCTCYVLQAQTVMMSRQPMRSTRGGGTGRGRPDRRRGMRVTSLCRRAWRSIPAVRAQIESVWALVLFDHAARHEVGAGVSRATARTGCT